MTDRDDLDAMLNMMVQFAQQQFDKRGGFLPFFATINNAGELSPGMIQTETDQPGGPRLLEESRNALKSLARTDRIKAAGLASDVNLRGGIDAYSEAIHILLEHKSGRVVHFYLPYRQSAGGTIEYGEAVFEPGQPEIFA